MAVAVFFTGDLGSGDFFQQGSSAFAATAPLDLVGPVSDYKIYVTEEIGELVTQTQAFTDAVKKGDLATAKKLSCPADRFC